MYTARGASMPHCKQRSTPKRCREGAFGTRALGTGAAMTPDTLFRIASMTKPVTCVAALRPVRARHLSDAGRRMSQGERL
jgi:hypothetical protein